jgi:hypothetical protein
VELRVHPSSRISGVVRNEGGRPVSGAEIKALGKGGAPFVAKSDSMGAYVLEVYPGEVALAAVHSRYAPTVAGRIEALPGAWANVDILLKDGEEVTGSVIDPSGEPIAGARVRAQRIGPGSDLSHFYGPVYSGDRGEFVMPHLGQGDHVVGAEAPGYTGRFKRIYIGPGHDAGRIEIELGGGRTLSGYVLDAKGLPLEDASVTIRGGDPGGNGSAVTKKGGEFELAGLPVGPYRLSISKDGFTPAFRNGRIPANADLKITLTRMGRLSGEVEFNSLGQEGVEILALGPGGIRHRTYSDLGGRFEFRAIPAGRYEVEARAGSLAGRRRGVAVPSGGEADEGRIPLRGRGGE